jgi:integrase
MCLFLKEGIWWVELQERDFVRRRSTFETNKNRAREVARTLALRPYTAEGVARLREMCLGDVINRYVDMVLLTKRKKLNDDLRKSARNDLLRLRRIEEFFGRRERVTNVAKPRSIADFNYSLVHEMKPGSANRYLTILRAVLFKAYEWGVLRVRPEVKLNKAPMFRSRYLSDQEEHQLIKCCSEPIRDYVVFLLDTGARKQEALQLRWSEVDHERHPQPAVTFLETKDGNPRSVPVPERTAKMLKRRRKEIPGSQPLVFMQKATMDIFKSSQGAGYYARKGDWIPLSAVQMHFERSRARAGLTDCQMHDLQHTYASKLIKRGVPILSVARLLGHQTIDMTLRYAHLAPAGLDEHVAKLDFPRAGKTGPRPRADGMSNHDAPTGVELALMAKEKGNRRIVNHSGPGRTIYVRGSNRRLIAKAV